MVLLVPGLGGLAKSYFRIALAATELSVRFQTTINIAALLNKKRGLLMDYLQMTAPCGLDCFNCVFYLAHEDQEAMNNVEKMSAEYDVPKEAMLCSGCRNHDGKIPLQIHLFGEDHRCSAYECSKSKGLKLCGDCDEFPCDNLHPYSDKADILPHNIKVFNLCLINKFGLEKWTESKASNVRKTYFNKPWTLC